MVRGALRETGVHHAVAVTGHRRPGRRQRRQARRDRLGRLGAIGGTDVCASTRRRSGSAAAVTPCGGRRSGRPSRASWSRERPERARRPRAEAFFRAVAGRSPRGRRWPRRSLPVLAQVSGQPVPPGNLHVTLAFLGSVPGSALVRAVRSGRAGALAGGRARVRAPRILGEAQGPGRDGEPRFRRPASRSSSGSGRGSSRSASPARRVPGGRT